MASTPVVDVNEILNALEKFINQRPRLDFANYGNLTSYRAEVREIGKQKKRALRLLAEIERSYTRKELDPNGALLLDSFTRAYSGRLEWKTSQQCAKCGYRTTDPKDPGCENGSHEYETVAGHLEYTTGQYWPTEYRQAAAAVLDTYKSLLAQKYNELHPQTFKFRNMAEVKAANASIGLHWFDRSTMRFFNTRIESELMTRGASGRQVFVTSEYMDDPSEKRYTIREAKPDGSIDNVGEFQQYETLEDAKSGVKMLS